MKKWLVNFLRTLAGLLLLFLTAGLLWTLAALPKPYSLENQLLPFLLSFAAGGVWFTFVSRLQVFYVFGHELTHWFAAKLFLRHTGDLKVSTKGGSVAVQNPNLWITLAPYFVPFYTLAWLLVYAIFRFAYGPPTALVQKLLFAGCGLTFAFHAVLTVQSLLQEQADLKAHGRFPSLALILFFNTLFVSAGMLTVGGQWRAGADLYVNRLGLEWRGVAGAVEWLYEAGLATAGWLQGWL
ncbi:MAG: hypothetical protein WC789_02560 [Lentisphaeria bacterium]|jgi:hypothetical protein